MLDFEVGFNIGEEFWQLLKILFFFQDYYKVLEVEYDATDDRIRTNYLRLALVSFSYTLFCLIY